MLTLTDTLLLAQKNIYSRKYVKVKLTHNSTEYNYYVDDLENLELNEQMFDHNAEVVINNANKGLSDLDVKGYDVTISLGFITSQGIETVDRAPLNVLDQKLDSTADDLLCTLKLIGIPNLLAEDRASESYQPDDTDTKTIKTYCTDILGATLSCFSHCKAYTIEWGTLDSLIDTFMPKDSFRIYSDSSRLAALRWLLEQTECVMRFKPDGKVYIFKPTTTGTTYDYQYSLTGKDNHTFFAKAYQKSLVIPNKVIVKDDEDSPTYSGYAVDQPSIDALEQTLIRTYIRPVTSNGQADSIAEAILSKFRMKANAGGANAPVNLGAEIFDYVKVTDEREENYRVGNLGNLRFIYKPERYDLNFSFGKWLSVRQLLNDIEVTEGNYFSRLQAKHAYIENLLVTNIDAVWIDPEGNVDLDKIGDTIDNLQDGSIYARVKTLHLDAGQIKLDENIFYATGYDPTEKEKEIPKQPTAPSSPETDDLWLDTSVTPNVLKRWNGSSWEKADPEDLDDLPDGTTYKKVLSTQITAGKIYISSETSFAVNYDPTTKMPGDADLDDIPNGTTYQKILATDISAGHIKLTSQTVIDAEWYNESGVEIDATHGINIYGVDNALTTRATKTGQIQCSVNSAGAITAASGKVKLDYDGLKIIGDDVGGAFVNFYNSSVQIRGYILHRYSDNVFLVTGANCDLYLSAGVGYSVKLGVDLIPVGTIDIGSSSYPFSEGRFNTLYANTALYVPAVP